MTTLVSLGVGGMRHLIKLIISFRLPMLPCTLRICVITKLCTSLKFNCGHLNAMVAVVAGENNAFFN